MKVCFRCRVDKDYSEFCRSKRNKDGHSGICRACVKIYGHQRHAQKQQIKNEKKRIFLEENKEILAKEKMEKRAKQKARKMAHDRLYYQINKAEFARKRREKYYADIEKTRAQKREEYHKNKEAFNRRMRRRYKKNIAFRLVHACRTSLNKGLRLQGAEKFTSVMRLCGCTPDFLRQHLESQFSPGMTWDNRGVWRIGQPMTWHIDHIKPCMSFDLSKKEDQQKCFHYTNLRPMWARDNIIKSDTVLP